MVVVGALRLPREPIVLPVWWSLKLRKISVGCMTQDCGGVTVPSCKLTQNNHKMCWRRPLCLWRSQGEQTSLLGLLGRMLVQ